MHRGRPDEAGWDDLRRSEELLQHDVHAAQQLSHKEVLSGLVERRLSAFVPFLRRGQTEARLGGTSWRSCPVHRGREVCDGSQGRRAEREGCRTRVGDEPGDGLGGGHRGSRRSARKSGDDEGGGQLTEGGNSSNSNQKRLEVEVDEVLLGSPACLGHGFLPPRDWPAARILLPPSRNRIQTRSSSIASFPPIFPHSITTFSSSFSSPHSTSSLYPGPF